jgi:small subunit ribosomal protein S14
MAKKSVVNRNKKRIKMSDRQKALRLELRKQTLDPKLSDDEKLLAQKKLQKLPRNGSATRVRVRCSITGRGRGCYKKFGLCRVKFRELALEGLIPGVTKASW